VSDLAKDLITKILVKDPKKRLNAEQILSHPWMNGDKTPRTNLTYFENKNKKIMS